MEKVSFDREIDWYMTYCRLRKQSILQSRMLRMQIMDARKCVNRIWKEYTEWEEFGVEPSDRQIEINRWDEPFEDLFIVEYLSDLEHNLRGEKENLELQNGYIKDSWTLAELFNQ